MGREGNEIAIPEAALSLGLRASLHPLRCMRESLGCSSIDAHAVSQSKLRSINWIDTLPSPAILDCGLVTHRGGTMSLLREVSMKKVLLVSLIGVMLSLGRASVANQTSDLDGDGEVDQ